MARKVYNKKKASSSASQVDAIARFEVGAIAEISTDMGWVAATVLAVISIAEGFLYTVHYVPAWDKSGNGGNTMVTGSAIR